MIYLGYVYYNPNPLKKSCGDCVIRAISKALGQSWEQTYTELALQGYMMSDMPSSNAVWGTYLVGKNFEEGSLMRRCLSCYTLQDFCEDFSVGTYIVGTDSHAVAVIDGTVFDSFDSRDMYPTYYFKKIEEENKDG